MIDSTVGSSIRIRKLKIDLTPKVDHWT